MHILPNLHSFYSFIFNVYKDVIKNYKPEFLNKVEENLEEDSEINDQQIHDESKYILVVEPL